MGEKLQSDREFTQPKKDALAKGLNVAVAPEQIPVADPITATSVIRKQQVGRHIYAEKLQPKVSTGI